MTRRRGFVVNAGLNCTLSSDGPVKDGESRAVTLSPALLSVLLEWKEACPPLADAPDAPCFPCGDYHGRRMGKDSMLAALDAAYTDANAENGAAKLARLSRMAARSRSSA